MIETKQDLKRALKGSRFDQQEIVAMPVLDTSELAFAVALDPEDVESAWREARELVEATGRWPVAVELWRSPESASLFTRVTHADLFSRFAFRKSGELDERSPRDIVERAATVDVDAFLDELEREADTEKYRQSHFEAALAATKRIYGRGPTGKQRAALRTDSRFAFDRGLLDWELAQDEDASLEWMNPGWYVPDNPILLFLPTSHGCEALAYLGWWGSTYHDAASDVALLRRWESQHGAELVSHYGTMLEFLVAEPPTSVDAAWALGREQCLVAPCNLLLPGEELRHFSRGLVHSGRWSLHERP